MRILVTNDDGVESPGIRALEQQLAKIATVTVVSPDRERSATGHSLTFYQPVKIRKVRSGKNLQVYTCDGTPSDCVLIGIYDLLADEKPDMVVSGINRGANLGDDITYSGTVSAAMEGLLHGCRSMAVSVCGHEDMTFTYAAEFARKFVPVVLEYGLPPRTFLNVNVPNVPKKQIKGVAVTRQGHTRYDQRLIKRADPRGAEYYWITGAIPTGDPIEGTDFEAIFQNKVSITPLHLNLTNPDYIDDLKKWQIPL